MRLSFILIQLVVYALFAYIIITQVLIPAARGTQLFPFFRKERKIKDQLLDVDQRNYESALEHELYLRRMALNDEHDAEEQRQSEFYGKERKLPTFDEWHMHVYGRAFDEIHPWNKAITGAEWAETASAELTEKGKAYIEMLRDYPRSYHAASAANEDGKEFN